MLSHTDLSKFSLSPEKQESTATKPVSIIEGILRSIPRTMGTCKIFAATIVKPTAPPKRTFLWLCSPSRLLVWNNRQPVTNIAAPKK